MRRLNALVIALFTVVVCLSFTSAAFATNLVSKPAKPSAGYSKVRIHYWNDDTGADWWRTFKASTTKTTFRVYSSYDAGHSVKTVSFTKFRAYIGSSNPSSLMKLKWHWKGKGAKRFRCIDSITVSNYDG